MKTAYLGLGSNQGNRLTHLRSAVEQLEARDGLRGTAASPVYETEAHTRSPNEDQPPFLNAVLRLETTRAPETLLQIAHEVEQAEGRLRTEGAEWVPRPLDVDLLAVDDVTCRTDTLTLPHPRLGVRRFVLRPWADLAPNFVVPPPFNQSVRSLLRECADPAAVRRTEKRLDGSTPDGVPENRP